jgi:hypothetical protein
MQKPPSCARETLIDKSASSVISICGPIGRNIAGRKSESHSASGTLGIMQQAHQSSAGRGFANDARRCWRTSP